MTAELSPDDKRALNHVEQEAAHGHGAEALKDLKAWRDATDDAGKYRLAAKELETTGVLPVLGVAQLNDKVTKGGASIDQPRISDLADNYDPIDRAIWSAARDNLNGAYHAPKGSWSGTAYEDADSLKLLQVKIDGGAAGLPIADALTANNNALFNKFSKDGTIDPATLNGFLMNQDGTPAERALARKLLTGLTSGSAESRPLTPYETGERITTASLNEFRTLHPDAPADLPAAPAAQVADTPQLGPDGKPLPPHVKLGPDGKLLGDDGKPLPDGVKLGPNSTLVDADGKPVGLDGKPLPAGPDGKPLPAGVHLGPDGKLLGDDGKPLPDGVKLGPNSTLVDADGKPVGLDGKPLPAGPDGKPLPPHVHLGPDGKLLGDDGKPLPDGVKLGPNSTLVGADGKPVGLDGKPLPPAADPPADAGQKLTLSTKGHATLWSMAYAQVMGHEYKKGQHWTNAQNIQILQMTQLLQAAHKGVVRKDREENIDITLPAPPPAPAPAG
jgi:hypothetical protein